MPRFALFFLFSVGLLAVQAFHVLPKEPRSRWSLRTLTQKLPNNYDWRKQGFVTAVKNQGRLEVPEVFAVVGAVESAWAIQTGKLFVLSEQELVDCSLASDAPLHPGDTLERISLLGGLELNSTYPYVANQGVCKLNKTEIAVRIDGYVHMHNEDTMARYLMKNGPIVAAFNGRAHLQSYKSGILRLNETECSPSADYDHVALIVGFGTEKNVPFWILKNSWGEAWGERGYFRMFRGGNTCGVANNAFAPYFYLLHSF